MSKLARQQTIIDLAQEAPLPNQHELGKLLAKRGFPVTQATLSRDLNELRLVKTSEGYVLPGADALTEPVPAVSRVVRGSVRDTRRSPNVWGVALHSTQYAARCVTLAKCHRTRTP